MGGKQRRAGRCRADARARALPCFPLDSPVTQTRLSLEPQLRSQTSSIAVQIKYEEDVLGGNGAGLNYSPRGGERPALGSEALPICVTVFTPPHGWRTQRANPKKKNNSFYGAAGEGGKVTQGQQNIPGREPTSPSLVSRSAHSRSISEDGVETEAVHRLRSLRHGAHPPVRELRSKLKKSPTDGNTAACP